MPGRKGSTLAHFAPSSVTKKKCFVTLAPVVDVIKLFSAYNYATVSLTPAKVLMKYLYIGVVLIIPKKVL